jgi:hypothetical protein
VKLLMALLVAKTLVASTVRDGADLGVQLLVAKSPSGAPPHREALGRSQLLVRHGSWSGAPLGNGEPCAPMTTATGLRWHTSQPHACARMAGEEGLREGGGGGELG